MKKLKKIVIVAICVIILLLPMLLSAQVGPFVSKIASSLAAWSGVNRLIPVLARSGSAARWLVGLSTPASIGVMAAAIFAQYAIAHYDLISGFTNWLTSKYYRIQDGAYQKAGSITYAPVVGSGIESDSAVVIAANPAGVVEYFGTSGAAAIAYIAWHDGMDNYMYSGCNSCAGSYAHAYGWYGPQSNPSWKYFIYPAEGYENQMQGTGSGWIPKTANDLADELVVDLNASDAIARSLWEAMERKISAALQSQTDALNFALNPTGGLAMDTIKAALLGSLPTLSKEDLIAAGVLPAAGTDVTTAVTAANTAVKANPDVATAVAGTVTSTYTKTAWSTVGDFGLQFTTFINAMKLTGVFALPGVITTGMPSSGNPVISFNARSLGQHSYDFSNSSWQAILLILRSLILLVCSIIAVKIIILKR